MLDEGEYADSEAPSAAAALDAAATRLPGLKCRGEESVCSKPSLQPSSSGKPSDDVKVAESFGVTSALLYGRKLRLKAKQI